MTEIESGRPNSPFFVILKPLGVEVNNGEPLKLKHPRKADEIKAICVGSFTEKWTELPDSFCLLAYGRNAAELRNEIIKRNPEYRHETTARFLMLREIQ